MDLIIRDAVTADAAAITDIYNQAVLNTTATFDLVPQSVDERLAWLASHGAKHPVLVAEQDGSVVGWASLSRYSDRAAWDRTAEVSTYVHESARGRGIGRALTIAALDRAAANETHVLIARICAENEASLHMCDTLGFSRVGVMHEVGEKFGRILDVVILEKVL